MTENGIKSKERVRDHGEVFTPKHIVNDMLDLVKNETERIDSRFLEPACGNGNFLAPILERKLVKVKEKYSSIQIEFERSAIIAVGSVYGVEILQDNIEACIERLFNIVDEIYSKLYKDKCKEDFRHSIRFVLRRNILLGDATTLRRPDNNEFIIFSQWSPVNGSMIKRVDYKFAELAEFNPKTPTLFSPKQISDTGEAVFLPEPTNEKFPLINYLSLGHETN